jgi:hypothetical protein
VTQKNYGKTVARLVQEVLAEEGADTPYTTCLQHVRNHIAKQPGGLTAEARALLVADLLKRQGPE